MRLADNENATILSQAFTPVDTVREGNAVKFTGQPGRYAVLITRAGTLDTLIAEIPGKPGPTPLPIDPVEPVVPDPIVPNPVDPAPPPTDLTGFALDVYKQAWAVGDKPMAAKLSANFMKAAASAGQSREDLVAALIQLNVSTAPGPKWVSFGKWAGSEANKRGQTLPEIRGVYKELARGLEAASR